MAIPSDMGGLPPEAGIVPEGPTAALLRALAATKPPKSLAETLARIRGLFFDVGEWIACSVV